MRITYDPTVDALYIRFTDEDVQCEVVRLNDQVAVNIGMVVGLLPVTGIPLPFITYGGSSLVSLLFGMGILESVRMHAHKPTL